MTSDDDKAQAFFILNDADVVERKIIDVLETLFMINQRTVSSHINARNFLGRLLDADIRHGGTILDSRLGQHLHGNFSGHFMSELRIRIQELVREELAHIPRELETRIEQLKKLEKATQYKRYLK